MLPTCYQISEPLHRENQNSEHSTEFGGQSLSSVEGLMQNDLKSHHKLEWLQGKLLELTDEKKIAKQ